MFFFVKPEGVGWDRGGRASGGRMKCREAETEVDKDPADEDGVRRTGRNTRLWRKLIETNSKYLPIQFSPAARLAGD